MSTKKIVFDNKTAVIPPGIRVNQVWDTDINEIKDAINTNADQQIENTNDIATLQGLDVSTYQLKSNMQSTWVDDPSGLKYPQLEATRVVLENIIKAFGDSGLISNYDNILLVDESDTSLKVLANEFPFLFHNNINSGVDATFKKFPEVIVPLSSIGLTTDGIYIRYVSYLSNGTLNFSDISNNQDNTYCQIGRIILKVSGGVTTFIDAFGTGIRNVKTRPDIAGYNNLLRLYAELSSDVLLLPNANLTMNHLGGVVTGISVNWGGANPNKRVALAAPIVTFTPVNASLLTTATPPVPTTTLDTTRYWNGTALVVIPSNVNATVQRVLISDNSTIVIQVGEVVYSNFADAKAAYSVAPFSDLLPTTSYTEIGRIVAVKNTSDLSNENDCQFFATASAGGGGGGASAGTDISVVMQPTQAIIVSDTGLDGIMPLATGVNAGLLNPLGTENYLTKYSASGIVDSIISEIAGRILIGATDNAVDKLQVNGSILGTIIKGSNYGLFGTGAVSKIHISSDGFQALNSALDAYSILNMYATKYTFNIGNVLINTTTDNGVDKLQVEGSGYFSGNLSLSGTGSRTLKIERTAGSSLTLASSILATGSHIRTNTLSRLAMGVNNADYFYISTGGNVLINTETDNGVDKLQVNGSISTITNTGIQARFSVNSGSGDSSSITIGGGRAMFGFNGNTVIQGNTSRGIDFNVNDATFGSGTVMRVTSSGNVLINTTTNNGLDKLQVNGSASLEGALKIKGVTVLDTDTANIYIKSNDGIHFQTSGTSKVFLSNAGNLLINTITNNGVDKLQVSGSGYFSGNLKTDGAILVKNSNNATKGKILKASTGWFIYHDEITSNADFVLGNGEFVMAKQLSPLILATTKTTLLTASRNYELPDANGTFALKENTLSLLTESAQTGFALPYNRTFYGDIGQDAVDFSFSDTVSSVFGATGESSFAAGVDVIASGYLGTVFGWQNNSAGIGSFVTGYNQLETGYTNTLLGIGHDLDGMACTVVGQAADSINNSVASYNVVTDFVFVVGNGVINNATYAVTSRSTAFSIKKSGQANIKTTPVYANNAAALSGGLIAGDIYKTSTGALMIVY